MTRNNKISTEIKIGIDVRLWNQTGVGRYIRNLVINLLQIDERNEYVLFVRKKDEAEIKNQISKFKIKNLKLKIVSVNISWHSLSEQLKLGKIIEKEKVDLMHFPYYSLPIFYKGAYVVTIHDLILHHFASGHSSTLPYWLYGFKMLAYRVVINKAARNARKIIAVSNETKNEITDHLMVNKNNIEVIYEAADDFKTQSSEKNDLGKYFLFVGNVYPHKNADSLIKAFEIICKDLDVKLLFVGPDDHFYKILKKQTKKFGEKIIFDHNVTDTKLASLYENAIGLIRPSLMEGFSLPPLEAIESRCLVIASDIPVHKEILGDAAIYFDPKNISDITDKMNFALNISEKEKENYIKKGEIRAREFSWEKTARKTLELYESSTGL